MAQGKRSVLFVCLGNICRSPMAEAVFLHLLKERSLEDNWYADSAGLGPWHVGKSPDPRTLKVLEENNIPYSNKARVIKESDFDNFEYIFGMDDENISELQNLGGSKRAKVELLGSYDPKGDRIIEDPYYERGDKGFYKCYEQCLRSCEAFLTISEL